MVFVALILLSLFSSKFQSSLALKSTANDRIPVSDYSKGIEKTSTSEHVADNTKYPNKRTSFIKEIQYAPLVQPQDKHYDDEVFKPTPTADDDLSTLKPTTSTRTVLHKKNLEPRLSSDSSHKCFNNPGQHVKVLTSVSRSPGHNAIYRTLPEVVARDKSFKTGGTADIIHKRCGFSKKLWLKIHNQSVIRLNYMRPYAVYGTMQAPTTKDISLDPGIRVDISHQKIDEMLNLGPTKTKRQPLSANKIHKMLHLNIARVYNPAQVSVKAPMYIDSYSFNMRGRRDEPAVQAYLSHNILPSVHNNIKQNTFVD